MKEFRLHVRRDRSSSVLRWVRNDDVNGALVGWWKCWWWWVFSRAQEVCFLTLQSIPSPLISCLPCSMFALARAPTFILPSGRNTCICQNGGRMEAKERKNVSHRSEVQPWRNTELKAVWVPELYEPVHICVLKKVLMKNSCLKESQHKCWWIVKVSEEGGSSNVCCLTVGF